MLVWGCVRALRGDAGAVLRAPCGSPRLSLQGASRQSSRFITCSASPGQPGMAASGRQTARPPHQRPPAVKPALWDEEFGPDLWEAEDRRAALVTELAAYLASPAGWQQLTQASGSWHDKAREGSEHGWLECRQERRSKREWALGAAPLECGDGWPGRCRSVQVLPLHPRSLRLPACHMLAGHC